MAAKWRLTFVTHLLPPPPLGLLLLGHTPAIHGRTEELSLRGSRLKNGTGDVRVLCMSAFNSLFPFSLCFLIRASAVFSTTLRT